MLCKSALPVVFGGRSAAALALRKNKAIWLFECGEDTQRQLLRQPLVRPGKIDRIFLSRASADCVLGLPGAGPGQSHAYRLASLHVLLADYHVGAPIIIHLSDICQAP